MAAGKILRGEFLSTFFSRPDSNVASPLSGEEKLLIWEVTPRSLVGLICSRLNPLGIG